MFLPIKMLIDQFNRELCDCVLYDFGDDGGGSCANHERMGMKYTLETVDLSPKQFS